ncbi:MAG: class I SAM-dependent methyltransferase, partial [Gammaproteobacteria bacterium]|nr:class I SAM-dependent methyltransferase [Gammaproteobacteria bacterium]
MKDEQKEHDFGFQKVSETEKTEKVTEVFDSVAGKYDLMNDLMSLGIHRFWKKFTLMHTGLTEGMIALDVAGGTGD